MLSGFTAKTAVCKQRCKGMLQACKVTLQTIAAFFFRIVKCYRFVAIKRERKVQVTIMDILDVAGMPVSERKAVIRIVAWMLVILLEVTVLADPVCTMYLERIFDGLRTPVAGSWETLQSGRDNTTGNESALQPLRQESEAADNRAILLSETNLPELSGTKKRTAEEDVLSEYMLPTLVLPENRPDERRPEPVIPGLQPDEWRPGPVISGIQSDNWKPEPSASEGEEEDFNAIRQNAGNTEEQTPILPDPVLPEKPSEDIGTVTPGLAVPEKEAVENPPEEAPVPTPIVPGETVTDSSISGIPSAEDAGNSSAHVTVPAKDSTDAPVPVIPDTAVPENPALDITADGSQTEPEPSCFLMDEAGMLYGFDAEYAELEDGVLYIPDACTGIRSGAFAECEAEITELFIPAGVSVIEEGAFVGLDSLTGIEVAEENAGYSSLQGVLFDSAMSSLLAFPGGRLGVYSVPSCVGSIAGSAFYHTSLVRLDIRECDGLRISGDAFGEMSGTGPVIFVRRGESGRYQEMMAGCDVSFQE